MKIVSIRLEKLAIRSIISNNKDISSWLLGTLKSDHFYYPTAKETFQRISKILSKQGEIPSWIDIINDPSLSESTRDSLANYTKKPVSSKNKAKKLVENLDQYRLLRVIYNRSKENINKLKKDSVDISDLFDKNRETFNQENIIYDQDESFRHYGTKNNSSNLIERLKNNKSNPVIPTGISAFDRINVGIPIGSLFLIAATTGSGKSILSMIIGMNMAEYGARVCMVSLEMERDELEIRLLSSKSGIEMNKFLDPKSRMGPEDYRRLDRAEKRFNKRLKQVNSTFSFMIPPGDPSIEELFIYLKPFNYNVYIIDLINLLRGLSGDMQWQKLGEATRFAKRFASNNNCIVIVVVQATSEGIVRYSRAMVEHSANAWLWTLNEKARQEHIIKISQLKARNQKVFDFRVKEDFSRMRIESYDDSLGEETKSSKSSRTKSKDKEKDYYSI